MTAFNNLYDACGFRTDAECAMVLNASRRSVMYWKSGKHPVPEIVLDFMALLAEFDRSREFLDGAIASRRNAEWEASLEDDEG